jgi:hypothetical protein
VGHIREANQDQVRRGYRCLAVQQGHLIKDN